MDNDLDYTILQREPVDFIELAFGDELTDYQKDIAYSVRDSRVTTVRSCHGSGKTRDAADIALWFLHSFPDSKVITTAPTFRQVEDVLWREIRSARSRARVNLGGRLLNTSLDIGDQWFALGLSTDDPDRFQGFHAVHLLLIVDEASGVAEDIFDASEGVVSSDHARVLYIGNPTNIEGTFYKSFKLPTYRKIHISAFDTPNFTAFGITIEDIRRNTWKDKVTAPLPRPYLITPEWVYDKYLRWGEGSPMWDSRVLGNFPEQGEDTLIPLIRIEEATQRVVEAKPDDPEQIGVDIARFGSDKTVFIYRMGPKVMDIREHHHMDTMATAQILSDYAALFPNATVGIDAVGVGAGVFDRLKQLLLKRLILEVNVGQQPFDRERYANLRAEIFWALRERFIDGSISIPADEDLMSQLANIKFKYTTKGQIQIESKEDMKKRGLVSPDRADALAIAFGRLKGGVSYAVINMAPVVSTPTAQPPVQPIAVPDDQRKRLELQADMEAIRQQRGW